SELMEIRPGARVGRGEGGGFQGEKAEPARLIAGFGTGELQKARTIETDPVTGKSKVTSVAPVTPGEARSVFNFFRDEIGKHPESVSELRDGIDSLATLWEDGNLRAKHRPIISALAKIASQALRSRPWFTPEQAYNKALNDIYEIFKTFNTEEGFVVDTLGKFAKETKPA